MNSLLIRLVHCSALWALSGSLLCQAAPLLLKVAPVGTGVEGGAVTLDAALVRAEKLSRDAWPSEGVEIRLAAGVYRLDQPLRISSRHSGKPGAPLVFKGPDHGEAILSGARVLGFAPLAAGEAPAIPPTARTNIRRTELPLGLVELHQLARQGMGLDVKPAPLTLYYRGEPMPLARWPNQGYAPIAKPDAAQMPEIDAAMVVLSEGRFTAWARESDLWMHGYWGRDWADEWVAVERVDVQSRALHLRGGPPRYGIVPGQRVRIVNALSELDEPGEWYLDKSGHRLYFWPPGSLDAGSAEVAVLEAVLVVHGASHVHFEGVDVEGARGDAIVVTGGRDVRISRARIRNAGGRAVYMSGVDHAVVDCDIRDTGQGGITLWGGDRQTLAPARLLAQGNRIQRFERWVRTYRPAITLGGVGNVARGNLILDGAHSGLIFFGNDHLIELNELHSLARETGDVGAIYAGRDWTARGTVVRHNYFHDIRGPGLHGSRGVYLDDQISGITIFGNLFLRVDRPVFLGGGRDNLIDNNLFIASSPALHLDARGLTWWKKQTDDPDGELRRRLRSVPYREAPYVDRYPGLAEILERSPGSPQGNVARRNAVVDGRQSELQHGTERLLKQEDWFSAAHLVFRRGEQPSMAKSPLDLRLDEGSTALRQGFAPLPVEEMACISRRWVDAGGDPRRLRDCSADTGR